MLSRVTGRGDDVQPCWFMNASVQYTCVYRSRGPLSQTAVSPLALQVPPAPALVASPMQSTDTLFSVPRKPDVDVNENVAVPESVAPLVGWVSVPGTRFSTVVGIVTSLSPPSVSTAWMAMKKLPLPTRLPPLLRPSHTDARRVS